MFVDAQSIALMEETYSSERNDFHFQRLITAYSRAFAINADANCTIVLA
jgi:hypothetical protein